MTRPSGRALRVLAVNVASRASADPVAAALLATRLLPSGMRTRVLPLVGRVSAVPVAAAGARWESGDRAAALELLASVQGNGRRRRAASLALALDRPDVAATLVARLPVGSPATPRLAALVDARTGHLCAAVGALAVAAARRPRERRTARASRRLAGELATLSVPGPVAGQIRRLPADRPVPGRVLHLVTNALPDKAGGYTVRTQLIARAQQAVGLDPHLVTRFGFPVAQGRFGAPVDVDVDGVPVHHLLPSGPVPSTADEVLRRGVDAADALVARLRPAVLHAATNHLNGQVALALRERHGLPVVYEVRGFLEETWVSRWGDAALATDQYRLNRESETRCMLSADRVVTLSSVMRDEIVSRGVPADRVVVVPNGVEEAMLAPAHDAGALRAALGVGPDEVLLGAVTSAVAYEGLSDLLTATVLLRERGLPVRALVVGDGPELAGLRRSEAAAVGAALLPGRVPHAEVRRHLAALDVVVLPRTDSRVCRLVTPLKPYEAMAAGLPVVASRLPALAEVVQDGVTGLLAPPSDPSGLADVLAPLVADPARRRELGSAGREWVRAHATWSRHAQAYRQLYAELGAV